MQHRFAKVHLANQKQITRKKQVECQTWFLRRWDFSYSVHLWKIKLFSPIKQYRIWIYISPISFHTRIAEMVSQLQYDVPRKLFDTYLTGLNAASIKSRKFFNNIFYGQISGVTLCLLPWKFNTVPCEDFLNCLFRKQVFRK